MYKVTIKKKKCVPYFSLSGKPIHYRHFFLKKNKAMLDEKGSMGKQKKKERESDYISLYQTGIENTLK